MIYFAIENSRQDGLVAPRIKVGYAVDPMKRLKVLSRPKPDGQPDLIVLGVIPGGFEEEREFQHCLVDWLVAGEWFLATDDCIRTVKAIIANPEAHAKGKRSRRTDGIRLVPFGTTLPEDLIEDLKCEVATLKRMNARTTIASVVEQAVRQFIRGNERERERAGTWE